MKQLFAAIRRAPMLSGLAAVLVGAVTVPALLFAWGPDRPTYTVEEPAPHVTFNSITNNTNHGDERNFVQIRNYTDNGQFGENVDLVPGKEYEVSVFYHNNAADHLNAAEYNYRGIAKDAYMKVQMPATVTAGDKARVGATIGASNAQPSSVWDEAYGANKSNGTVALRYVPNSAKITSNGAVNGQTLDLAKLASADGMPLGYDKLDGDLKGCFEYSGYVQYRFVVDQPNFEVTKEVSLKAKNDWKDSVSAKPGEVVDFRIHYKNTGTVAQTNVSIRDDLPANLDFVEGSAKFFNSKTNGVWQPISDTDAIVTSGVDFGAFGPNGGTYVALQARVADVSKLECGTNTLKNRAVVTTQNGTKHDTATVTVEKECQEPEQPEEPGMVKVCDPETGDIISVEESDKDNYLPVDADECKDEEETPVVNELPKTGAGSVLLGLLGVGTLSTATYYYVTSRRI